MPSLISIAGALPGVFLFCSMLPAHAQSGADEPRGLPAGGGLDAQKITELRYGAAAPAERPTPPPPAVPETSKAKPPVVAAAAADTAPATANATARPAPIPGALATLWLERGSGTNAAAQVPVTFGQVFAPGALKRETRLGIALADGKRIALQMDAKAFHADGTVRHAIISSILPAPTALPLALGLVKLAGDPRAQPTPPAPANATPAALIQSGLTASVKLVIDGKPYVASLEGLLAKGKPVAWLSGPVVHEWHVSAPLAERNGQQHPHLAARFAVRWYPALKQARVDVTVENDWAYEAAPQNFIYDAEIEVGGKTVYRQAGLTHYHHARWRKLAWWGGEPALHLRHDTRQLIDSYALPNYDPAVRIDERALAQMAAEWTGASTAPMGVGRASMYMPGTGGRPDIGLQPGWAVAYLLSMDPRAKKVTNGTADLAGSWSIHYRDRRTGLPVSLLDYPYMTILGRATDTRNPATGKLEAFPGCATDDGCKTPNVHDVPHQPNLAYLPYLLTGDHYYLEELQFWAMYNAFSDNPHYRQNRKGLLAPGQVRGQAWGLRTLAEAAYITPDTHALKPQFQKILDENLDWYNAEYTNNPKANALGVIVNGYSVGYQEGTAIAPWQDDFFTAAVGHVAELGFAKAIGLLKWKAQYPVARMVGSGSCWIDAAMYSMRIRDRADAPFHTTIARSFERSRTPDVAKLACGSPEMAAALKLRTGEMTGYSPSNTGYPSNMQPALAYAADVAGAPGRKAWRQFMARSVKPDYGEGAQFAIVPRGR